ncbi:hypothetical protein BX666DRAFT_1139233 [Dichotomocladium elegans]|nr:hypothetical protein BX666DRAFT_1139233 [Dichotomocladium elegans]
MTATDDQLQKALTLLEEGDRALSLNNYMTSVSKLGEACQLFDAIYGELAPECGDAYYSYGRALLQNAIEQNTVLGNAGNAEEAPKSVGSSNKQQPVNSAKFHFEDDEEEEQEQADDDDNEEEDNEKEPEEDDFEMAWDMLDLARVVFEKDEGKQLKLADVYLCLGDVSAETEKFDQAVQDYRKALEIKQGLLEESDRQLAEAHYKIALALEFSTTESEFAGAEIQKAIEVLKKRLEKLQAMSEGKGKGKGKALATDIAADDSGKENGEISELITIMEEKVEELAARQKTQKEAEAALKSIFGGASEEKLSSAAATALANATVNDLSSLVKRKKTVDGEESNKKQKQ